MDIYAPLANQLGIFERLEAWDRVGLLHDITSMVSEEHVNIASCISEEHEDVSIISPTIYVGGIGQLSLLNRKLEDIKGVLHISHATS